MKRIKRIRIYDECVIYTKYAGVEDIYLLDIGDEFDVDFHSPKTGTLSPEVAYNLICMRRATWIDPKTDRTLDEIDDEAMRLLDGSMKLIEEILETDGSNKNTPGH